MSIDKKRKLPVGWKMMKLKQLGLLSQGGTPSTDVSEYWDGNYPFITGADVTELFVSNARSYLTEKGLDSGKTQRCENGDLLIVSRTRVGRIGMAAKTLGVSQDVSVLKVDKSYDAKYLAIFLISISKQLEEACQGSTIKGLTRGYIENINIPIPPTLSDQLTIASDLEKRMTQVEKMRGAALRQKEAIGAMKGAILSEIFSYEEGDELPEGWKWKTIKDVIEKNIQVFNPENYGKEKFNYIDITGVDNVRKKISNASQILVKEAPSRAKTILRENDIIISTVRPNLNAVALLDKSNEGNICSSGFCVIRLKDDYHARYFFHYLTSPYFVDAVSNMVQGAMYPAISNDDVKGFSIPLPPTISEQTIISSDLERKMSELEKARLAAEKQLDAIEALPGAILREVFDFEEEYSGSQKE
ncbi:Type-1 restriction enzyme MjaXIP specificity protein [uncultured archaeon]|nr:Type-1 restriction enzyme MjaXIP specificity protein [uncultured archaeon]